MFQQHKHVFRWYQPDLPSSNTTHDVAVSSYVQPQPLSKLRDEGVSAHQASACQLCYGDPLEIHG